MRKKLTAVLLVLAVVLLVFCVVVAMQPNEYSVTRSATIAAPPEAVFPHVNDFHQWEAWSPWAKLDPAAKNTFEGPESGTGAIFKWSGNDDVGEGMMTIQDSQPTERIKIKLDFIRPFADTADVVFAFKPEDDQTTVNWSMSGKHNFMSKLFCLFMSMDKMIGADFEKGLASMKSTVEAKPATEASPPVEASRSVETKAPGENPAAAAGPDVKPE